MPKVKISEYSATANSNTDVASINIDEGCAPSGINNAIRAIMGHLKDFQSGTNGDPFNGPVNGSVGATTPSTGAFTTLSASSTVTLSGGTANGVAYLNGSKVLTTGSALVFDGTNLSLGTVGSKVNFATTSSATVNYVGGSADGFSLEMVTQRGASQPLKYKQDYGVGHVWSVAGSDKMTLDASGNLGVGATSIPSYTRLQVTGTAGAQTDAKQQITISAPTTTVGEGAGIRINAASGAKEAVGVIGVVNNASGNLGSMTFGVYNGGATVPEYMRLDNSGNLLAGTTSANPSAHHVLQYSDTAKFAAAVVNSSASTSALGLYVNYSLLTPNGTGSEFIYCADFTALRMSVRSNGGIANYSANDVNLSDRREKTNFAPSKSYLDVICAIPVQTFNYIDQNMEDDGGLTLGVVAQDVQAVAPELVMESNWAGKDEEPKMRLSIYQTDLQYALMKCIQEMKSIIDDQAARIATLEAK